MEQVIILDYSTTVSTIVNIPNDVIDVVSYLEKNYGFDMDNCSYMVAHEINIIDLRINNK